ncbi:MAG TPA: GNAT family N-acetyltransferase [Caulobacteraceae bacterium]
MAEVRPYGPEMRGLWNSFNREAVNGHFLFDRDFMDYHSDRFTDASLIVFEGDRAVGLIAASREGATIHSHQGLSFGGLVVQDTGVSASLAMLDACAAGWRGAGAQAMVYKALPSIYHRAPANGDLYWLFRRGAALVRRDASTVIDYRAPGPRSERRARGARKAARAGLTFGRSTRWGDYWRVLEDVLRDRHVAAPTHSLAEIELLAGRFPDGISLHLAELAGEVQAGVVIFATDEVAHAQYIAVGEAGRANGALDGLFDHLIAAQNQRRYFSFGISTTEGGQALNEGLVRQKEEFGGGPVMHDVYRLAL